MPPGNRAHGTQGKEATRCTEGGARGWFASCTGRADVESCPGTGGSSTFSEKEQEPELRGPQRSRRRTDSLCVQLTFAKRLFVSGERLLTCQDKPSAAAARPPPPSLEERGERPLQGDVCGESLCLPLLSDPGQS